MAESQNLSGRRRFLGTAAALSTAFIPRPAHAYAPDDRINVIGPKSGYSPQIGTLVSMLTWMQGQVLASARNLTQGNLDYLFDKNANTIGALLLHLAATETYYGMHTFEGKKWDSWPESVKKQWDPAMNLGQAGRDTIKGHDLNYYLQILQETRAKTLAEFKKRDDAWLLSVDESLPWGPTNNYCKWFHVCEHESHHAGQISLLRSRLPGAKPNQG
ncbi:MAG: hypothetical protein JWP63_3454 [Candidatus Solibacter sp.]|nr:hypothetical protein [Candidatus Solibacter sp.]